MKGACWVIVLVARRRGVGLATCALAAALSSTACTSPVETNVPDPGCAESQLVAGGCAGLPTTVCADAEWTDGVECTAIEAVTNAAELDAALARAAPGHCIDLAPATYGPVTLPPGVNLLGRGHTCTIVGRLVMAQGGMVRGVTIQGGAEVSGTDAARLEFVRIAAQENGITVLEGASVQLVRSEIEGASRYGISAFGASRLSVEGTLIVGHQQGAGIWAECTGGCSCAASLEVSLHTVRVRDGATVGVHLVGADATVHGLEITGTWVSPDFEGGTGFVSSGCGTLDASALSLFENTNPGLVLQDTEANLSGVQARGNLYGLVVNNPGGQRVTLEGSELRENKGVSLLVKPDSSLVSVRDTTIASTLLTRLPVLVDGVTAGTVDTSDGINWCTGASMVLDGVSLEQNQRASVLIDGPVGLGSRIANMTLIGIDEELGIMQINLRPGGAKPDIAADVPYRVVSGTEFPVGCSGTSSAPGI